MSHEASQPIHVKDPNDVLDFPFDWSDWLPAGDEIDTIAFEATPGIVIGDTSNTETVAIVWLSGGTAGHAYMVTNRITTVGGRTKEKSMIIKVINQ